jgi:hypothetical protein
MPLAAVTRLRVRSLRFLPQFLLGTYRSLAQARRADGCLAADVRATSGRVFWTRTLWRDGAAMRAYMIGGAHRTVMPKLLHWCDEASLADWEHATLPEWADAEARLRSSGRLSRVRHPSPAQARGETAPAG